MEADKRIARGPSVYPLISAAASDLFAEPPTGRPIRAGYCGVIFAGEDGFAFECGCDPAMAAVPSPAETNRLRLAARASPLGEPRPVAGSQPGPALKPCTP